MIHDFVNVHTLVTLTQVNPEAYRHSAATSSNWALLKIQRFKLLYKNRNSNVTYKMFVFTFISQKYKGPSLFTICLFTSFVLTTNLYTLYK